MGEGLLEIGLWLGAGGMTGRRVVLVEQMMQVLAEMGGVLDQMVNLVRMELMVR